MIDADSSTHFPDLDQELDRTRRILEALPDGSLDWRPHERSMSVGELSYHVSNLVMWMVGMVEEDSYDLAQSPPPGAPEDLTRDTVVGRFNEFQGLLRSRLETVSAERLQAPWTLRKGDDVIFTLPRSAVIRSMGLSHIAHHRGQLSVYLRLLDVPVPGLYGPSADESMG